MKFKEADIPAILRQVLQSNDMQEFNEAAKAEMVKFLEGLAEFYEKVNTRAFLGSSIVVIVDNISKQFRIKWLDFNYPLKQGQK